MNLNFSSRTKRIREMQRRFKFGSIFVKGGEVSSESSLWFKVNPLAENKFVKL